jgi:hypothetical protein
MYGFNVAAAERVALVIGDSAYQVSALRNPVNDARDMLNAMHGFRQKLRGTQAIGLFYFAGLGADEGGG